MARFPKKNSNSKNLNTQKSVNSAIKSICDIMRRSNCAWSLQYVPELTWILFLRILDEREMREAEEAEAVGAEFTPSFVFPYRWQDWAAPDGAKRQQLQNGTFGAFFGFVNGEMLPYLKSLHDRPGAMPRQKVIAEIMSGVERVRIDTERNFLDVLDKVHEISNESVDQTHVFTLSQIYEGLLLKMGEKGNDGGQFFTPREIIRAMVKVVEPGLSDASVSLAKHSDARGVESILEEMKGLTDAVANGAVILLKAMIEISKTKGEDDNCLAFMEGMLAIKPDDHDTRFSLSYKYSEVGENDLALYHYRLIAKQRPNEGVWNNLGVASTNLGLIGKSIKAYRESEKQGEGVPLR